MDRRALLEHIASLATDADAVDDAPRVFLPLPSHRIALRPDIVVIEGMRGAGKTALFQLLKQLGKQTSLFFEDRSIPEATWVDAFSEAKEHPSSTEMDELARTLDTAHDTQLRAFWIVHLLARLESEGVPGARMPEAIARARRDADSRLGTWLPIAERSIGEAVAALDAVDDTLRGEKRFVFASYDHLDRLGMLDESRTIRQRLVRALVAFWLSSSTRMRHLRGKLFLRPDLFEEAERSFPDASKLRPRSVSLEWTVESLYRLTIRHLANRGPHIKALRAWLEKATNVELESHQVDAFGCIPGDMPEAKQKSFAMALAGETMGRGAKKGYTHRWIPARLKDADGRIAPRSFLRLIALAAKTGAHDLPGVGPLMDPTWLVGALQETSRARVNELKEEYPFVSRLSNLEGQTMLMQPKQVVAALARSSESNDGFGKDGAAVFDELRRIGVVEVRDDGRVDIPDIYRYGYGIKRKGGAKAPK